MSDDKVWLITGSNTGFGEAVAREALSRGDRVIATARRPETVTLGYGPDRVLPLPLDVTDAAGVEAAVATGVEHFGRVDVLVNNAGHGLIGTLEELSDEQIDDVLSVNVLGAARMTRAVLPTMRAQRSGTIVQMSSVGGVVANPGHAIYGTSKFALEGMSEALAGEVAPLGIRVIIVEPGPFRTEFAGRSMTFAEPIDDYADTPAGAVRRRFRAQDGVQPNDPARAATLIADAVLRSDTPLRIPLGPEAIDRIRTKLTTQLEDLERWAPIGVDTRF